MGFEWLSWKKNGKIFEEEVRLSVPRNNEWMVVFHIWNNCPIQKSATLIYQPDNLTARVIKQDKNYSEFCWVVNGRDDVFFVLLELSFWWEADTCQDKKNIIDVNSYFLQLQWGPTNTLRKFHIVDT